MGEEPDPGAGAGSPASARTAVCIVRVERVPDNVRVTVTTTDDVDAWRTSTNRVAVTAAQALAQVAQFLRRNAQEAPDLGGG